MRWTGERTREPRRGGAGLRIVALQAALAALWVAAWGVARIQEFAPHASLWFPPAGLTFAAFAVLGIRAVPGIAAGAFLVTLRPWALDRAHFPLRELLAAALLFTLAHAIAYGIGAITFRRWAGASVPRAVTAFLLVAPASSAVAALGGAYSLAVSGVIPHAAVRAILVPWFIGDFVAVAALAPALATLLEVIAAALRVPTSGLLVRARRLAPRAPGLRALAARLALCLLPIAVSAVLLVGFGRRELAASFLVFFAVLPLMWIVHTEGALRTFWSVAFLSVAIAGAGALLAPGDHTSAYQFAMIVLAGTSYFGLAVPSLYLDNVNLRRLATTDGLTGALTRAFFLETAEREFERSRRFASRFSLVLLDVDRFKAVNDSLGHPFGDAALAEVVSRLRRGLRDTDAVGRMGGEEFAILLPMTGAPAAAETAERLAQALREAPIRYDGAEATVTASFGVAEVDAQEGLERALVRADRALYEAKNAGRDRVVLAASSPGEKR